MPHRALDPHDREYFLPPLFWPTELRVPDGPPTIVHLDLAQWIRFGQVLQGRGDPTYAELLEVVLEAVRVRRIQIVISGAQYSEVIKIKDPAQRRALARVIEELSDFNYLASHVDVIRLELQTTLDRLTGTRGLGWGPIDLVGRSALNVMGRVGGLRVMQDGEDVTSSLLADDPSWVDRLAEMNRISERMLLHGPDDVEARELRADGYQPEQIEERVIGNAILEADWATQIKKYRRTHFTRDLVIARYIRLELMELLVREQMARDIQMNDIFTTPEDGMRFLMSMPSSAVVASMKAQYHQDPSRRWTSNDLFDIDALALAIPYCDIVFADAAARDAALRRGLDRHFGTFLPRRPADLTAKLQSMI